MGTHCPCPPDSSSQSSLFTQLFLIPRIIPLLPSTKKRLTCQPTGMTLLVWFYLV